MAGATILCGEGALRSGIGLLRIVAAPVNAVAIHAAIPAALFQQWPVTPPELEKLASSSDVIAIGPGLGNSPMTRDLVERMLQSSGRRVDLSSPFVDASLPDGSRLRHGRH